MNTKTALKTSLIVALTALSLAACGSSGGGDKTTGTTGGATTGTTTGGTTGGTTGTTGDANSVQGTSHIQGQTSTVVASTGNIALSMPIYSKQTAATDQNKIYGIEFLDYDACYQGTAYGYSTTPAGNFNQLGFYFPEAPSAKTYNVGSAAGDIIAANGALGTGFTATQDPTSSDPNVLVCTGNFVGLASGTVTVTAATDTVVTGTLNLTLTDGSTISGDFTTGTCDAGDPSGAVVDPNGRSCRSEK